MLTDLYEFYNQLKKEYREELLETDIDPEGIRWYEDKISEVLNQIINTESRTKQTTAS